MIERLRASSRLIGWTFFIAALVALVIAGMCGHWPFAGRIAAIILGGLIILWSDDDTL